MPLGAKHDVVQFFIYLMNIFMPAWFCNFIDDVLYVNTHGCVAG